MRRHRHIRRPPSFDRTSCRNKMTLIVLTLTAGIIIMTIVRLSPLHANLHTQPISKQEPLKRKSNSKSLILKSANLENEPSSIMVLNSNKLPPASSSTVAVSSSFASVVSSPLQQWSLLVLVLTHPSHVSERQAIRETWGMSSRRTLPYTHRLLFVMGSMNTDVPDVDAIDVIVLDHIPDTYEHLTQKLQHGWKYIDEHYSPLEALWILKVDDDCMARLDHIQAWLHTHSIIYTPATSHTTTNGEPSTTISSHRMWNPLVDAVVIGDLVLHAPVQRQGRWADTQSDSSTYPPWPRGSTGYLISRAVVSRAVTAAPWNDAIVSSSSGPGEDVWVGQLLHQWSTVDQSVTYVAASDMFVNHRQCLRPHWWVVGHRLGPAAIRECHRLLRLRKDSVPAPVLMPHPAFSHWEQLGWVPNATQA
jgi:hypothetical protein